MYFKKSAPLIDTKLSSEFAQLKCREPDEFFSSNEVKKKLESINRKSRKICNLFEEIYDIYDMKL